MSGQRLFEGRYCGLRKLEGDPRVVGSPQGWQPGGAMACRGVVVSVSGGRRSGASRPKMARGRPITILGDFPHRPGRGHGEGAALCGRGACVAAVRHHPGGAPGCVPASPWQSGCPPALRGVATAQEVGRAWGWRGPLLVLAAGTGMRKAWVRSRRHSAKRLSARMQSVILIFMVLRSIRVPCARRMWHF